MTLYPLACSMMIHYTEKTQKERILPGQSMSIRCSKVLSSSTPPTVHLHPLIARFKTHAVPKRTEGSSLCLPLCLSVLPNAARKSTHSIAIRPTSRSCCGSYPNAMGSLLRLSFAIFSTILTITTSPACFNAGTPHSSSSLASKCNQGGS